LKQFNASPAWRGAAVMRVGWTGMAAQLLAGIGRKVIPELSTAVT
jgi:hypothetical protein